MTRWTFLILAATCLIGSSSTVHAQFYGGMVYGPHHHSGFYAGGFAPGSYSYYGSPLRVAPGYVNTYGMSTGYYGIGSMGYGTSYGLNGYTPIIGAPMPVYGTTTTIIRGGPTGGAIQYTNNGNGYTYTSDSNYPTVIQQQPTLGLSRTIVPPSPPPVLIETQAQNSRLNQSTTSRLQPPGPLSGSGGGMIKLSCPKTAPGELSYSLNGHLYTIQPGYSQSFRDDRAWTLEFKRGGDGSEVARYPLKAGTYSFVLGSNGWEIQQGTVPSAVTTDIPPAPLPDLSTSPSPSLPPSPLPPP